MTMTAAAPIRFTATHKGTQAHKYCSDCRTGNQAHPDIYMRAYYHIPSSREHVAWQCVSFDAVRDLWVCTCEHGEVCRTKNETPRCHHVETARALIASGVFPTPETLVEGRRLKFEGTDVRLVQRQGGRWVVEIGRIVDSSPYELFDGDSDNGIEGVEIGDEGEEMPSQEYYAMIDAWAAEKRNK